MKTLAALTLGFGILYAFNGVESSDDALSILGFGVLAIALSVTALVWAINANTKGGK